MYRNVGNSTNLQNFKHMENNMTSGCSYRRRKAVGTLKLSGTCDIFEAAALHAAAVKAPSDSAADEKPSAAGRSEMATACCRALCRVRDA